MPMPPIAANNNAEGSGTADGLPPKSAAGAKAVAPPNAEPDDEPIVLLSAASKPEPVSTSGAEPLDDQTDAGGSAARTRSSNRLTSKPGSVAAKRSIAARRFSSCWPFALLIEPEAIAA